MDSLWNAYVAWQKHTDSQDKKFVCDKYLKLNVYIIEKALVSSFLQTVCYLNERLYRHFEFPNEHKFPFLIWGGGRLIETGAHIKFFSCEEGRSFEGGVHVDWGAPRNNYGICNMIEVIYYINRATGRCQACLSSTSLVGHRINFSTFSKA